MPSLDVILLVSDKPDLNMIVSRIYHHLCWDFIMINFLMGKANERTTLSSSLQLFITMPFLPWLYYILIILHLPQSVLKVWFCNVEWLVNTFFFCIIGEDEKLRKSWSTKPLEGKRVYKTDIFLCAASDTLPEKLTLFEIAGTELQDIQKIITASRIHWISAEYPSC